MARPKKQRNIELKVSVDSFIPKYKRIPEAIEEVQIALDELEALRLTNTEELSQEDTAEKMGISRQLVGLLLERARKKITEALVEGKIITIIDYD